MHTFAPWHHSANVAGRFVVPGLLVLLAAGAVIWPPAGWTLILLLPLLAVAGRGFFQRRGALGRK